MTLITPRNQIKCISRENSTLYHHHYHNNNYNIKPQNKTSHVIFYEEEVKNTAIRGCHHFYPLNCKLKLTENLCNTQTHRHK